MGKAGKYIKSIFRGDFLTAIKADRNIPFILYVFVLVILYITLNLLIEKSMTIRQENDRIIEELRTDYTQKSLELVSIDTRSKVKEMLEKKGSDLEEPRQAPVKIEDNRK